MNTTTVSTPAGEIHENLAARLARAAWNVAQDVRRWYWRTFRVETRGVRVALLRPASGAADGEEVLLVRHRYGSLWVMPGGGLNRHESPLAGASREAKEETGLALDGRLLVLGDYRNNQGGKRDTVTVVVCEQVRGEPSGSSFELSHMEWFPTWALPDGASAATRRRVAEIEAWRRGELELPISGTGEW